MTSTSISRRPWRRPPRKVRRALLWSTLVALLLVAQTLLVLLTLNYENVRAQERVEDFAGQVASELRRDVQRGLQSLQALLWHEPAPAQWRIDAGELLRARHALLRIERRNASFGIDDAVDTPYRAPVFSQLPRTAMGVEAELACTGARRTGTPMFSRTYFVPQPAGTGLEVLDVCIPVSTGVREPLYLVATLALSVLLEESMSPEQSRGHELSFIEGDGTRLARAGVPRGAGVYQAQRVIDLPGASLVLRVDSAEGSPRLIPNLATALVLGLSLALFAVVLLLLRDVRKRARAESALGEALAFRKAMEDSLITGLRARDLEGRITYVNPAFCAMVGFGAEELMDSNPPAYWPTERVEEYRVRQSQRLSSVRDRGDIQQGFETEFMRKNGERFPVVIYEAPLVDSVGKQKGWMSAVLDMSAQRRVEELSRQQQDRLQATARLATVGEMASLLSHELNQPLAAIASYATGSLNLIETPDDDTVGLLKQGLTRIAEQAERAGRVIKSVHDFVRRREQAREAISASQLIDAVMPLVRLQARKSGARIELDIPSPPPRVLADRTMVEQVLLNLTRNGIQAMETATPLAARVLTLRVRQTHPKWVSFSVLDAGPGIAPEVAERLFTPFFTTRSEGMGLGLSLCRTVIEQHGGALDFHVHGGADGGSTKGTEFVFTLPATDPSRNRGDAEVSGAKAVARPG
ncbi:ATP-binding protein [Aquincola sp. MAHUQ-54]|uniref:histidine kinase n=1 Tax=Aquincola agrisoli TaxID=3119538 RepID=A0AAW9Q6G9_9BURK